MSSTTTTRAKVSQVAGAVSADLAAAGGAYKVALFYEGAELSSGTGYSRATIDDLGPSSATEDGEAAQQSFQSVASWTADGGDWSIDELRVYDNDGVQLRHTVPLNATVLDGEDLDVTVIFERPADVPIRENALPMGPLLREYSTNATFDCSAGLAQGIKARRNGKRLRLELPPGRWRMALPDFFSLFTAAELQANRGFEITGACAEDEMQGADEWGLTPATTIMLDFDGATDADFWMSRESTYPQDGTYFGILRFTNIEFEIPEDKLASMFYFGPTSDIGGQAAFRGLQYDHCRFTNIDHPYQPGHKWGEDDATAGCFTVDKDRQSYGVHALNGYDCSITNCTFRGLDWPLLFDDSEGLHLDNNRFINCTRGPHNIGGGTVGEQSLNFVIAPVTIGIVSNCGVQRTPNVETGYPFTPTPGVKSLDGSGITWSITANASTIVLSNFPSGYDARDFLMDWSCIRVTPSQSGQPAREFVIYDVTTTGATLLHAGLDTQGTPQPKPCNVPVTISGDDASLERLFGVCALFYGDEVTIDSPIFNRNTNIGNVPLAIYAPLSKPMNLYGELYNAYLMGDGKPICMRHHMGGIGYLDGVLVQDGNVNPIDHPCVHRSGEGTVFRDDLRYWITDFKDARGTEWEYGCTPGRGVTTDTRQSAELFFRRAPAVDPLALEMSRYPWCYKLSDLVTDNYYEPKLPAYDNVELGIYCWSDANYSGANGLRMYDGVGFTLKDLSAGWNAITPFNLNSGATALRIYNNTNAGAAVYIASIGMNR